MSEDIDKFGYDLVYSITRNHEHKPSSEKIHELSHTELVWGFRKTLKIIQENALLPKTGLPVSVYGPFWDAIDSEIAYRGGGCGDYVYKKLLEECEKQKLKIMDMMNL